MLSIVTQLPKLQMNSLPPSRFITPLASHARHLSLCSLDFSRVTPHLRAVRSPVVVGRPSRRRSTPMAAARPCPRSNHNQNQKSIAPHSPLPLHPDHLLPTHSGRPHRGALLRLSSLLGRVTGRRRSTASHCSGANLRLHSSCAGDRASSPIMARCDC